MQKFLTAVPGQVPIAETLINPVVDANLLSAVTTSAPDSTVSASGSTRQASLIGEGPARDYLQVGETSDPAYPPRPVPGSIIDLDLILDKCDFGSNKVSPAVTMFIASGRVFLTFAQYVRDCLNILRIGGNLDNGKRIRKGKYTDKFKHLYKEEHFTPVKQDWTPVPFDPFQRPNTLSREALSLNAPLPVRGEYNPEKPCDPLHPRIFHMFWAGPFTDKPYMAIMSYLFTQNLGLDKGVQDVADSVGGTCRPQFWVWINPGPAASVPNPAAKTDMYRTLATNPWSAPFLHERFRDVVKFKMWNTTEQLDGIPELKPFWRNMEIFNSGGNVYNHKHASGNVQNTGDVEEQEADEQEADDEAAKAAHEAANADEDHVDEDANADEGSDEAAQEEKKKKDTLFAKVGSSSESDYDRLSVILSDMARFVLTHRFGGVYLDADTLFLRDWEELWNYRGQFAYRWSWHQKYNTAVLKLHKGSALGTFLFKTALENGLDFHPMTVSRYLQDAGLDKLLIRIPDALFDPAWLNMERYQRDRPPFPYFPEFSHFFSNDKSLTGGPEPLGFDGFFRGAYSYHFHNFWWLPFDPARDYPDLGERFSKGEMALRQAKAEAAAAGADAGAAAKVKAEKLDLANENDDDDLSWSTTLKRTFEAFVRGERPNMYGEWITWR